MTAPDSEAPDTDAPDPQAPDSQAPDPEQGGAAVRRRQPPGVRRQMLLAAARSVIADRGLHATTVRDVAAAGGVAVGTVTYHFSGMAEMLAEVLRAEMAEYSAAFMNAAEAAATGREALQHIINGLLADGERARRHWKLWLDFWALSAHDPQYAAWQREVYAELHGLVERSFRRGTADGSIAPMPAADTAAVEFVALQDGLVVQCYLPGSRLSPARARSMLADRLDEPRRR
ncbi:TetR/AcrR family transcriptional regulator [Nakamurella lactea]|uniref:TetR/AcrR family transcriptional regulator n=1 Tax=Nakamurella lactea TaxID=459515 RepID=UPI000420747E|nr:TetR/AcrR family transcriptional regulator [Nakamurella lactea]